MDIVDHSPTNCSKETIGKGDDEIALGLTAEAFSFTGRSFAYVVAPDKNPIQLAHGLVVLPGKIVGTDSVTHMLPALSADKSAQALDRSLEQIATIYGPETAYSVGKWFEYPGFKKYRPVSKQ